MEKLAIIGAAHGQLPLCLKAKEMGIETICFAWDDGAVCKDYVDKFYPISVLEKEKILSICMQEQIDGVVSNASDLLTEIVSYISENMGLIGNPYDTVCKMKNKYYIRELLKETNIVKPIKFIKYNTEASTTYPCVVKPISGSSKKGVYYVSSKEEIDSVISKVKAITDNILIEEYIDGREISVETISFQNKHYVLQITDKDSAGAPHFVELGHHQPADLSQELSERIHKIIPQLLDTVGFCNGATHIELKIDNENNIYLIEINPRGGGDEISSKLVELSTGYDYIKGMINVALGYFETPLILSHNYAGIYYLCNQVKERFEFFKNADNQDWLIEKKIIDYNLTVATGNYDRNGYLIYKSNKKIEIL